MLHSRHWIKVCFLLACLSLSLPSFLGRLFPHPPFKKYSICKAFFKKKSTDFGSSAQVAESIPLLQLQSLRASQTSIPHQVEKHSWKLPLASVTNSSAYLTPISLATEWAQHSQKIKPSEKMLAKHVFMLSLSTGSQPHATSKN